MFKPFKNTLLCPHSSGPSAALGVMIAFAATSCATVVDDIDSPLSFEGGVDAAIGDASFPDGGPADVDLNETDAPPPTPVCNGPPPIDRELPSSFETATFAYG